MLFLRYLSLFISIIGYVLLIDDKLKISLEYVFPIVVSSIILILYVLSIFINIRIFIWIIYWLGLFFFVYKIKKAYLFRDNYLLLVYIFISIFVIYALLNNRKLVFVDDFNHWGMIARLVTERCSLPTSSDKLIYFITYPPGACIWICYYTNIVGNISEGTYLIAQSSLVSIYSMTILGIINSRSSKKNNSILSKLSIFVATLVFESAFLTIGSRLTSLCVDGLLASIAVCSTIIILVCDINRKNIQFFIPLIVLPCIVKDAGLLYSLTNVAILLIKKSDKKTCLISFVSIVFCKLLWKFRIMLNFDDTLAAPHSINLARYINVFKDKLDNNFLFPILSKFLYYLFFACKKITCSVILIVIIVVIFINKNDRKLLKKPGFYLLVHYIVYEMGLLFVYIFSMGSESALLIDAYKRYIFVEILYLFSVFFCILCLYLKRNHIMHEKTNKIYRYLKIYLVAITLLFICDFSKLTVYENTSRSKMQSITNNTFHEDCVIYYPPSIADNARYEKSLLLNGSKYDFQNENIDIVLPDSFNDMNEMLNKHNYLIVYEYDDKISDLLKDVDSFSKNNHIYKIKHDGINVVFENY